jgi:hypothetical protein
MTTKIEYKPIFKNSISSVFQSIRNEVFDVIEFLGYSKDDYILEQYPFLLSRVDGYPVSKTILNCIKARLGGNSDLIS